jgi:putative ABC transport system permease protein
VSVTTRLAWRNLWRHGRRTWLTVGAMIFCNALLVFLLSVQLGSYAMMIDGTLSILTGHLQVQQAAYLDEPKMRNSVPNAIALADQLQQQTGLPLAVRANAFALASSEERSFGVQIMGVQPTREPAVSSLPGLVKEGQYLRADHTNSIVIGSVLARNLKVGLGDEITFLGSGLDGSFAAGVVTVGGIIDSGMAELDRAIAQITLSDFQSFFSMGDHAHYLVAKLDELTAVDSSKQQLANTLADQAQLKVLDWDELQPGLKQAIQADLTSAFVMYAVLIVLVAFSVLNTQLMSVLERTREFGVMMALGVKASRLSALVLLETAMMSALGLLLGCLLGYAITLYFQINGLYIPGMEEAMSRYNLPGRLYPLANWISILAGPLLVFAGGMLAAIYPALRLHRLQPVDAMKAV